MAALLKQLMEASIEPFDSAAAAASSSINPQENLATTTLNIQQDLQSLRSSIVQSLTVGDTMFGQMGHADLSRDVSERNKELQSKKEHLMKEIDKKESIINRSNRDFTDVKETLPETPPKKILTFIEDYTLAILSVAYVFMLVTAVYFYVVTTSDTIGVAIAQSLIGSVFVTLIAFMLLYYLS